MLDMNVESVSELSSLAYGIANVLLNTKSRTFQHQTQQFTILCCTMGSSHAVKEGTQ